MQKRKNLLVKILNHINNNNIKIIQLTTNTNTQRRLLNHEGTSPRLIW
jgi:hypothetical protein